MTNPQNREKLDYVSVTNIIPTSTGQSFAYPFSVRPHDKIETYDTNFFSDNKV